MRHLAFLVMTMAAGWMTACSDDDGGDDAQGAAGARAGTGGAAGTAGAAGTGGAAGRGGGGAGGGGGTGGPPPVPPTPALPANAPTVTCPTQINGVLETSDGSQTGRHSRVAPVSACGAAKAYPGNAADATNPHLFDVYRFANPSSAAVCFELTLSYGAVAVVDAGADAGLDAGAVTVLDASADAGDAAVEVPVGPQPAKYLTAYGTFYPTDLSLEFLGDVGDTLTSPQSLGVTVAAGETVDVVVYAVDNAPVGGAYTLSCSTL